MPRILIASDKFKGSLTATQVAESIQHILETDWPEAECDVCPIADGGEGTTDAMVAALKGQWVTVDTQDAQGRHRSAVYGWITDDSGPQAIMEMSAASGLVWVNDLPLNPATATTFGTGEMIRHAAERGAERIVIGIGGSATNDGGLGMAAALGFRFLDASGADLPALLTEIHHLDRILPPAGLHLLPAIVAACDVDNPLLGPQGATRVYGPQKGVTQPEWFEERLEHLANIVARDLGRDPRNEPGSGAAGGLGFGLMAFLNAKLTSGFDLIASQIGLEKRVREADLIITGEGRMDSQTLHGKGPMGVAKLARQHGKAVVAYAGSVDDSPALSAALDHVWACKPAEMPLSEALAKAAMLLETRVRETLPALKDLLSR